MMRGFTLIEAMVALLLLSCAALALSQCLVLAHNAQKASRTWMRAVALAEEGLERARPGAGSGRDTSGIFRRRWSSSTAGAHLRRIEVVVEWNTQEFRLATLVWE
jgi:prepilin-type N-terminal cleavage/methylation domain-containing protein